MTKWCMNGGRGAAYLPRQPVPAGLSGILRGANGRLVGRDGAGVCTADNRVCSRASTAQAARLIC
jgi:hypothetical protein